MSTKKLSIAGSTGSIGRQALSLVQDLDIDIVSISGFRNVALLEEQALRHKPKYVCVGDTAAAECLKISLAHTDTKVFAGGEDLARMVAEDESDTVLTAVVGIAGLLPTLAAIKAKKDIALANKETLVAGGQIVMECVQEHGVRVFPVDSEHSAIFQCLQDRFTKDSLTKVFLTASGGPFFGFTRQQLEGVAVSDALKHPTWTMGSKITIDSATMMNKGLELIEAMWLFGLPPQDIEVVIHRQSIIHSMVELSDGSVLAQMGVPDMRTPIQYALTWPHRAQNSDIPRLTLAHLCQLTFDAVDTHVFGCLPACRKAAEMGGTAPCVANAANEEAVMLFLQGKIGFLDIERAVCSALEKTGAEKLHCAEQLLEVDSNVRVATRDLFK